MSDTTLEDDDDLSQTQEYFIAGTVILLFGLLYWFLNGGWNTDTLTLNSSASPTLSSSRALGPIPLANFAPDADPAGVDGTGSEQTERSSQTTAPVTSAAASTTAAETTPAHHTAHAAHTAAAPAPAIRQATGDTAAQAQASAEPSTPAHNSAATAPADNQAQIQLTEAPAPTVAQPEQQEPAQPEQTAPDTTAEPAPATGMVEAPPSPQASTQPVVTSEYSLPDGTPVAISSAPETELRDLMASKTLDKPVTFPDVRFAQGSATLTAESEQSVKAIAALMNAHADSKILVRGHTDRIGETIDNTRLSLMRASTLGNALVKLGIDKARIIIMGMGDQQPIDSNDTEAGRSKNRRVDVSLTQ